MDQETTVNRVLRDMKLARLITLDEVGDERIAEMRVLCNAIYTAGWEEKNKAWADKRSIPVVQCDKKGKPIQRFHNVLIASRKTKYNRVTIYTSLKSGKPTQRGHIWKYAQDENTSGSIMGEE
jgi:hypothetical protein